MSAAGELQDLVEARLKADAAVAALVGDRVYDGPPLDAVYPYISFGPSDTVPDDADCISGTIETLQIDCWTNTAGQLWACRELTAAVRKALHDYDGVLATEALACPLQVTRSQVFRDPDGISAHGIVVVEATIEEVA